MFRLKLVNSITRESLFHTNVFPTRAAAEEKGRLLEEVVRSINESDGNPARLLYYVEEVAA